MSRPAGQISSQGALQFKVLPNTQGPDGQVRVTVARVAIDPETALPGEGAVLKTLQSALRCAPPRTPPAPMHPARCLPAAHPL